MENEKRKMKKKKTETEDNLTESNTLLVKRRNVFDTLFAAQTHSHQLLAPCNVKRSKKFDSNTIHRHRYGYGHWTWAQHRQ